MENIATQIIEKYIDFVLTHHQRPESVYRFMKENIEIEEQHFYQYFASFSELEQVVWDNQLEVCINKMQSEAVYQEYSIREKFLALYYTLIEEMKGKRSFAKYSLAFYDWWNNDYAVLDRFKKRFKEHTNALINEGIYSGEVAERPFLTERYANVLWWQMLFLLKFWVDDQSKSFESTDAAIEKSVNLMMDALGENIADSTFDFVRFIIQK